MSVIRKRPRFGGRLHVLGLAAVLLVVASCSPVGALNGATLGGAKVNDASCLHPTVSITTSAGPIRVVLYRDAAPQAVDRLLSLVEGSSSGEPGAGLVDLQFEFVRPYAEVRSGPLPGGESWPLENDGRHLGLDDQVITTEGESMETIQAEFLAVHGKNKNQPPTAQFAKWIEQWRADRDPRLLVGVSRLELLQSFGFVYQTGLASRPVERGSLVMRNEGTRFAEPRLTFALGDRLRETGQWMVVGRVVAGLEMIQDLSIRPLENEFAKRGRPREPARVMDAQLICTPAESDG